MGMIKPAGSSETKSRQGIDFTLLDDTLDRFPSWCFLVVKRGLSPSLFGVYYSGGKTLDKSAPVSLLYCRKECRQPFLILRRPAAGPMDFPVFYEHKVIAAMRNQFRVMRDYKNRFTHLT